MLVLIQHHPGPTYSPKCLLVRSQNYGIDQYSLLSLPVLETTYADPPNSHHIHSIIIVTVHSFFVCILYFFVYFVYHNNLVCAQFQVA